MMTHRERKIAESLHDAYARQKRRMAIVAMAMLFSAFGAGYMVGLLVARMMA